MGRVITCVLLALVCVHHAAGWCDVRVLRSVGVLRIDTDDSGVLDSLVSEGSYELVYVTIGQLSPLINAQQCLQVAFSRTESGYQVQYKGVGTFPLAYNQYDNAIDVIGSDGQAVSKYYVIYNSGGVVAFYICSPEGNEFTIGSVFVASSALTSSHSSVAKAVKALSDVGVKNGLKVAPCHQ